MNSDTIGEDSAAVRRCRGLCAERAKLRGAGSQIFFRVERASRRYAVKRGYMRL